MHQPFLILFKVIIYQPISATVENITASTVWCDRTLFI